MIATSKIVFNVVWTGSVFDHLQYLVASQMAHCDARYRFIANACPADQLAAMEGFADAHPGRVVEVIEVSRERMVPHGAALDDVIRTRDDGEVLALIDPDIIATGPFLESFLDLLDECDVVTSGKELWSDHNVRPADHPGVNGEYFYDQDGFVFGSPHIAFYRRSVLDEVLGRWPVGFASAGNALTPDVRAQLEAMGRSYWLYDTAKVVNILLQGDGGRLCHVEHPALLHIGGVSHYLAPASSAPAARDRPAAWGEEADWGRQPGLAVRFEVAQWTAEVLRALCEGASAPSVPEDVEPATHQKLELVRSTMIDVIERHGPPATTASRSPMSRP